MAYGEDYQVQRYTHGIDEISMDFWMLDDHDNGWIPGESDMNLSEERERLYYLHDELGSITKVIGENGKTSAHYNYDEFGVPKPSVKFDQNWPGPDNTFGFTGYQYDESAELWYAQERYYMPETGRFISEDPWSGTITTPTTMNPYPYVLNNPLKYVDPLGLQPWAGCPDGIGQTEEYIYADTIREKLIDNGFSGPQEYSIYDLNQKIMDGASSVIQDFLVGLSFEAAKSSGLKVVAYETGYGYVATAITASTVMDKYEKSNIIERLGGDKLEIYSYNEVILSGDGKLGTQTTVINKKVYIISEQNDERDVVVGIMAPASVTVSRTGTMSNTGVESTIFDFSQEVLEL